MSDNTKERSESDVANTQVGAQTGGAQAGTGSVTQAAGAQTGQAQAGAGAAYQSAGADATSDVGQSEAYILNLKRLVARELDLDAQLQQILLAKAQREATANVDFDGQLRNLALQTLQNAVSLNNRVNNGAIDLDTRVKSDGASSDSRRQDNAETFDKAMDAHVIGEKERTVRGGDAGDVIRWAALSENPVFQDAITAAVAKAVAAAKAVEAK